MGYIVRRRARFHALCGSDVNLPYGTRVERRGRDLFCQGKQLCWATSKIAHDYFPGMATGREKSAAHWWGQSFPACPNGTRGGMPAGQRSGGTHCASDIRGRTTKSNGTGTTIFTVLRWRTCGRSPLLWGAKT